MTKLKGMTFDHDFGYVFPLFSSPLKQREEEKEYGLAKIVIKSHTFQPGPIDLTKIRGLINLRSTKFCDAVYKATTLIIHRFMLA